MYELVLPPQALSPGESEEFVIETFGLVKGGNPLLPPTNSVPVSVTFPSASALTPSSHPPNV